MQGVFISTPVNDCISFSANGVAAAIDLCQGYDIKASCHASRQSLSGITQDWSIASICPIFPDICYHLTHYKPAAADIPVASDNPAHYADAIRYNARTPLQGSLLPLTRLVWA